MAAVNPKPFVIPELQLWKGGNGTFYLTDKTALVVADSSLLPVAKTFAEDLQTMFGRTFQVKTGKASSEDIYFDVQKIKSKNDEAYAIAIQIGRAHV